MITGIMWSLHDRYELHSSAALRKETPRYPAVTPLKIENQPKHVIIERCYQVPYTSKMAARKKTAPNTPKSISCRQVSVTGLKYG